MVERNNLLEDISIHSVFFVYKRNVQLYIIFQQLFFNSTIYEIGKLKLVSFQVLLAPPPPFSRVEWGGKGRGRRRENEVDAFARPQGDGDYAVEMPGEWRVLVGSLRPLANHPQPPTPRYS